HNVSLSIIFFFVFFFFFFFQAEDGIRDGHVTGVQTCALPISCSAATDTAQALRYLDALEAEHAFWMDGAERLAPGEAHRRVVRRSEERRVGKECRSRWAP